MHLLWPPFLPIFSDKEIRIQTTGNIKPLQQKSSQVAPNDPHYPWLYPCQVPSHTQSELTYVTQKIIKWQCVNSESFHKRHFGFHFASWITCSGNLTTLLSILQVPWGRPFLERNGGLLPIASVSYVCQQPWEADSPAPVKPSDETWQTSDYKLTERP